MDKDNKHKTYPEDIEKRIVSTDVQSSIGSATPADSKADIPSGKTSASNDGKQQDHVNNTGDDAHPKKQHDADAATG
jgi:hypothetical protein